MLVPARPRVSSLPTWKTEASGPLWLLLREGKENCIIDRLELRSHHPSEVRARSEPPAPSSP